MNKGIIKGGIRFSMLLFVVFLSARFYGQEGGIQVTCEPGIRIYLDGKFLGLSSLEEDGIFIKNILPGNHIIRVEKTGYSPKEFAFNLLKSEAIEIKVGRLLPIEMDESIESGKHNLKKKIANLRSSPKTFRDAKEAVETFFEPFIMNKSFENNFESVLLNGDKVIIDYASGLMWHPGGSEYKITSLRNRWLAKLNSQGYGGFSDWRIPTAEEAASLIQTTKTNEGLYISPLFSQEMNKMATTDCIMHCGYAIKIGFKGEKIFQEPQDWGCHLRPVRSMN